MMSICANIIGALWYDFHILRFWPPINFQNIQITRRNRFLHIVHFLQDFLIRMVLCQGMSLSKFKLRKKLFHDTLLYCTCRHISTHGQRKSKSIWLASAMEVLSTCELNFQNGWDTFQQKPGPLTGSASKPLFTIRHLQRKNEIWVVSRLHVYRWTWVMG